VVEFEAHNEVFPVIMALAAALSVTVKIPFEIQPVTSVIVTLYIPAVVTSILEVVAPPVHKYVAPVPPVAVKVALPPLQIATFAVLVTAGVTVIIAVAVAVQPRWRLFC
jgi:hypothetical protein